MDDIIIYASSLREHDIKIDKLMRRLKDANLTLQADKCEFLRHEVGYLGHIITDNGVRPDPQKITAVKNFPVPRNLRNVRQFLGLAGYYRRFIPNFSGIAKPLSELMKKDKKFVWDTNTQHAFDTLCDLLCKEPILQFPDFEKNFILTTDASEYAIAGILSQGPLGQDLPISYASRILNAAEKNYSTIEKEFLAIVYCVSHFRPYLYGRKFTLVTDHRPLIWVHRVKDPTSRLMRWRLKLEEYDYTVVFKQGATNQNADALSRNPIFHFTVCPISKRPHFHTRRFYGSSEDDSDDEPPLKIPTREAQYEGPEGLANISDSSDEIFTFPWRPPKTPRDEIRPVEECKGEEAVPGPSQINESNEPPFDLENVYLPPVFSSPPELTSESPVAFDLLEPRDEEIADVNERDSSEDNLEQEQELQATRNVKCCMKASNTPILKQDDNLVIFVAVDKSPLDKGAQELHQAGKLPLLDSLTLGRARIYPSPNPGKHIITLPVKERKNTMLDENIFNDCLTSLLDVINELQLRTISLRKTEKLDTIPWRRICFALYNVLSELPIVITISHEPTSTPAIENRKSIIQEHHESMVGGHKGVTKTYLRVKERFSWNNMKTDIQEYIRNCRICQAMKLVRKKTRQPMILTDTPGRAFDKVALDILGPLRTTPRGNTYILTMQDLLTKYSAYAPLPDARAETVAGAFVQYFICRFGCPKSVLTDQGTNFISQFMRNVTKRFRIQQLRTTAYHPQTNGSLERSHLVLVEYLKCFLSKEEHWDDLIERATFSYNTAVHEGTGYSPHELIFGRTARIPSSFNYEEDPETYCSHITNLFERIRDLQESARSNLIKAKERSKTYYDKRVNLKIFSPNDYVYLINNAKDNKLSKEYTGPYQVTEVLDNENVKIKMGNATRIVHVNRLKLAHLNREPG